MKLVALLMSLLVLSGLAALLYQPRWLIEALARRSPRVLYFVETRAPRIALTIDDGPDPTTTPRLLRILAEHDARATFFLISGRIPGNEDLVARIVEEGHELGNHLTRDRPSVTLTPAVFEAAFLEADSVLSRFADVRWVRPGSGWYSDTMLSIIADHGYRCALGSIYPYDATIPSADFAAFQIKRKARPGSIIVLHDGGSRGERTAATLREVLPDLRRQGFRVVTLSGLTATSDDAR